MECVKILEGQEAQKQKDQEEKQKRKEEREKKRKAKEKEKGTVIWKIFVKKFSWVAKSTKIYHTKLF